MSGRLSKLQVGAIPTLKSCLSVVLLVSATGCDAKMASSIAGSLPGEKYGQQSRNQAASTLLDTTGNYTAGTATYFGGSPSGGGGVAVSGGGGGGGQLGGYGGGYGGGSVSQQSSQAPSNEMIAQSRATADRKIVYNTNISLVVEDYRSFEGNLPKLVDSYTGFVAKSASNRQYQNNQTGEWIIRIPVANYVSFLSGINGLGFAESRQEDAQDITDQFVDIDARIRNSKKLEERIIKMVEERTGKMSDVLEIERELARVRQEIERMEGQLRLMSDQSDMATITIRCREQKEYSPPAAPTFASRLESNWSESTRSLVDFFANGVIALVSIVPWIATFGTPAVVGVWVLRRGLVKRRTTSKVTPKVDGVK